jgi:hypothetical protein
VRDECLTRRVLSKNQCVSDPPPPYTLTRVCTHWRTCGVVPFFEHAVVEQHTSIITVHNHRVWVDGNVWMDTGAHIEFERVGPCACMAGPQ